MISSHRSDPKRGAHVRGGEPVYIGLRLIRYGPLVTSVDTGWCRPTVVP